MFPRSFWKLILFTSAFMFVSCDPDFPVSASNPTSVSEITSNQTYIQFSVPIASFVSIVLQNMTGDEVRTILSKRVEAGIYSVQVDFSGIDRGRYYFITYKNGSEVRSLLVKLV